VDAKEVAKKCSKKFAVSCSAVEVGTVQLQGDNNENMREFLLAEYKQLKKKYMIDKEEFN
jgi:translation initiation factor 1 (eIF-1/SUI1)